MNDDDWIEAGTNWADEAKKIIDQQDELASLEKAKLKRRLTRKEERQWQKTRKKWIKDNPPPYGGYWYCIIGGRALTDDPEKMAYGALMLTLDHDIARSRDPSLRHELTNLNEMCAYHNGLKGSRSLVQFRRSNPPKTCKY